MPNKFINPQQTTINPQNPVDRAKRNMPDNAQPQARLRLKEPDPTAYFKKQNPPKIPSSKINGL